MFELSIQFQVHRLVLSILVNKFYSDLIQLLSFINECVKCFSEVWRAFDLEENKYVACKIHHVNKVRLFT